MKRHADAQPFSERDYRVQTNLPARAYRKILIIRDGKADVPALFAEPQLMLLLRELRESVQHAAHGHNLILYPFIQRNGLSSAYAASVPVFPEGGGGLHVSFAVFHQAAAAGRRAQFLFREGYGIDIGNRLLGFAERGILHAFDRGADGISAAP